MRIPGSVLLLLLLSGATGSLNAQYSSDFPGVSRAAVPFAGARQTRGQFDFVYFKVPSQTEKDSLAFGLRMGFGRSYRIQSQWQLGFDFSLLEGMHVRESGSGSEEEGFPSYTRGLLAYGLKVGLQFTPVVSLSPEGYGYHAGVGIAFQPSLEPLFGVSLENDRAETGGAFVSNEDDRDPVLSALPQFVQFSVMGSFRNEKLAVDGALLYENTKSADPGDPFPVETHSGVSPRFGVKYRLGRTFSPGLVFWGNGAPPWRDRVIARTPAENETSFGLVFDFGSHSESGTTVMIMSQREDFGKAIRLYISTRGAR